MSFLKCNNCEKHTTKGGSICLNWNISKNVHIHAASFTQVNHRIPNDEITADDNNQCAPFAIIKILHNVCLRAAVKSR